MPSARHTRLAIVSLLIALVAVLGPASAEAAAVKTSPDVRAAALEIAKQQVGDPYKLGAMGPDAFDCSGLVAFAFTSAGFDLGVRSSQDMAKLGANIRRTAIKPGDLVFTWSKTYGHVGIAVSATKYVHAPGPKRKVAIHPIPTGKDLIAVRRP